MQTEPKHLFDMVAEKHGLDKELVKDITLCVFDKLNDMLHAPPSLILKLKGVGRWRLRRKRVQFYVDLPKDDQWLEDKEKLITSFEERLKDYEIFIKKRNETREKRKLIKASQNNLGEHKSSI